MEVQTEELIVVVKEPVAEEVVVVQKEIVYKEKEVEQVN